ncbi:MAG: peptide-methionine (R)-S-oxide reductase [Cyclobacteriaceae bacterium]|jgi:peptide-methionine (R)-S-oxide reductase
MSKINKTNDEWMSELTPEQFKVLREKGTERAWTGALLNNKESGIYECAGCGNALFASDTKFDSGSGWPSFFAPVTADSVNLKMDKTLGMIRTEVTCSSCGGHLGHVFHDGPKPTGERYCMNSISLNFEKKS